MKSYIEKLDTPKPAIKYPCLMQASYDSPSKESFVVLFVRHRSGIVVQTPVDEPYTIGHQSHEWVMSCFKPFTDKIVLQNE